ncbi:hypothetical protein ACHQM5_002008 [Ranunculus cassubicifolius]
MGYDYVIEYKKGKENQGADALSRKLDGALLAISIPTTSWWSKLQKEVLLNPFYDDFAQNVVQSNVHHPTKRDGVWFYKDKILVCPDSELVKLILEECHSTPVGGHFGFQKTLAKVKFTFYWPGMHRKVKEFIRECDICQRCKSDTLAPAGLLQPLPIPERVWTDLSMDFFESLPYSHGKTVIMVIVDRLSKYAHFVALSHPFTALTVAQAFIDQVVRLHGIPTSIVSDRDKVFISAFWKNLFRLQGTKLCISSSYHPETDGQTEVVNRTLEQYLRCFTSSKPKQWMNWLAWAEYSYNTAIHSSTKMSPFQVVYGVPPPSMVSYVPGTTKLQAVDAHLRSREDLLKELRQNLLTSQSRMKAQANQHRREVSFEVGDYVYLKLQPYRQSSIEFRSSMKLAPRFYGPFQILERIGPVAYRLELPVGSKIHDVFHVSLLRKKLGAISPISDNVPPVTSNAEVLPQPALVLDSRVIKKGTYRPKTEILVKWKGAGIEDATWENKWRFSKSYPEFILEDKNVASGGE